MMQTAGWRGGWAADLRVCLHWR